MASESAGFVEIPLKDSDEVCLKFMHCILVNASSSMKIINTFIPTRLLSCYLISFLMVKKSLEFSNRKMRRYTSGLLLR